MNISFLPKLNISILLKMFYIIDYEALAAYFESNLLDKDIHYDRYEKLFKTYKVKCTEAEYVENIINLTLFENSLLEGFIYYMLDKSIENIKNMDALSHDTGKPCILIRIKTNSSIFNMYTDTLSTALKRISFIMYVGKHRSPNSFPIQSFGKEYIVTGSNFIKELLEERTIDIMHFIRYTKDVPKFDRQIYSLIKKMIPRKLEGFL